jgi:hypothetical protein
MQSGAVCSNQGGSDMSTEVESWEAAREAGTKYGTMATDLSLVHIGVASSEEEVQEHIRDLVRNIREQASQQADQGLGEDLATVWKEAAMEAAQARLAAFERFEGPTSRTHRQDKGPHARTARHLYPAR